ncbi:hypothetical protein ACE1ET_07700 [Saccharicrinis sp. FJH62]|uniref:hypothetical protein n=1 Tax=Saccharicrinis sp. FJH62 TaxID=3344657 RepID=UPI0035D5288B
MRNLSVVLIFTLLTASAFAQLKKSNLPPKSFYLQAKITTTDFNSYNGLNMNIKSDSLNFMSIENQIYESLALKNVKYLQVPEGNHFAAGAFWGGLISTAIGALSTYKNSTPHGLDDGKRIFKFSIGGAAIGGLIGLSLPKWKTYYIQKRN